MMKHLKTFESYDFRLTPIMVTPENYDEALQFRQKFQLFQNIGIATFLSVTYVWRIVDQFEFDNILKFKKITGGNWSVPPEKAFGASFSGSRQDVVEFGLKGLRTNRLKGQLYVIGINAEDKEFLNLNMVERLEEQGLEYKVGDFEINTVLGDRGLGFSVRNVTTHDIRHIYTLSLNDLTLHDVTHDYDHVLYN